MSPSLPRCWVGCARGEGRGWGASDAGELELTFSRRFPSCVRRLQEASSSRTKRFHCGQDSRLRLAGDVRVAIQTTASGSPGRPRFTRYCSPCPLRRQRAPTSARHHAELVTSLIAFSYHRPRAHTSGREEPAPHLSSAAQSADASTRARVGILTSRWILTPRSPHVETATAVRYPTNL